VVLADFYIKTQIRRGEAAKGLGEDLSRQAKQKDFNGGGGIALKKT